MKVYKFVFSLGLINLLVPFIGIPNAYKQYLYIITGIIALVYSLILRTIIKEKESGLMKEKKSQVEYQSESPQPTRKIEEVVEMEERREVTRSTQKTKRPTIKVVSHSKE